MEMLKLKVRGQCFNSALGKITEVRVRETIGRGTYGVVQKAICEKTKKVYALKVFHEINADGIYSNKDFVSFQKEFRASRKLDNNYVVKIHQMGTCYKNGNVPYLLMDYVKGNTLEELLVRHKKLDIQKKRYIAFRLIEGLALIHEKEIVHNDINPKNIIINHENSVKYLDFGISYFNHMTVKYFTQKKEGVISKFYRAPELWYNNSILDSYEILPTNFPADVFALGVILYELFSDSKRPYSAEMIEAYSYRNKNFEIPDESINKLECEGYLKEAIKSCLYLDPEIRLRNGKEVYSYVKYGAPYNKIPGNNKYRINIDDGNCYDITGEKYYLQMEKSRIEEIDNKKNDFLKKEIRKEKVKKIIFFLFIVITTFTIYFLLAILF